MTYIPQHFSVTDRQVLREFMQAHDFVTVISDSPEGFVASHVPVLVRSSGDTLVIVGHLARANHHWRLMNGATPALVIFQGPHGYVSPRWYGTAPAVPTWNYAVVHAHGLPRASEDDAFVRGVVEELAARYEGARPDGWRPDSLPANFYGGMRGAIVGFEMPATRLEGKFKLGQNRSADDRRRTIAELEKQRSPLADFMRRHAGVGSGFDS